MADERGFWDRILEGVDLGDYNPSNWSGEDIWNTISGPFAVSQMGKDEDVGAIYNRLSPEEKQAFHDRQKGINVTTEKPFMSVSRTGEPRAKASAMPTREDIISRLLASKSGPAITQGGGSPQTREGPSALKRIGSATKQFFGEDPKSVAGRPPIVPNPRALKIEAAKKAAVNKRQAALELARKRSLSERERIKTEAARKETQKAVGTLLKDRQTAPKKADIRSGEKAETRRKIAAAKKKRYQPRTVSEIAKTKETQKAVGTLLKDRQTAPDEVVIESARKAEAKRKAAKEKARISKVKPKVVKTKKKVVAEKKKPRSIKEAKKMKELYYFNKDGKKMAAVTKEDLADFRKKTGNPKATLRQLLNSITGKTQKGMYRTAKKTGGGVGLHTAEMRSAGKDLHKPQSKIKKRIHEEITYAKKGGKVGKKKQGYKARKDESIAMRVKKKRTKKQLKASRSDSYGKFGSGKGKGKINRFGSSLVASTYD